jgi:hypothetical protein
MARTKNNCITNGTSGKIGTMVLTVDGNMRSRPDVSGRVWSPLQKLHLERLEESKRYGRWAISDPEMNEFYARKAAKKHGLGAWHLAISDYYYPPVIVSADFRNVMIETERRIHICTSDNMEVVKVIISFISPATGLLENHHAEMESERPFRWCCHLHHTTEFFPGLVVLIRAMDHAGNITSTRLTWPFNCEDVIKFGQCGVQEPKTKHLKSQLRIRPE